MVPNTGSPAAVEYNYDSCQADLMADGSTEDKRNYPY